MEALCQKMLTVQQFDLPPLPNNLPSGCHPNFASISKQTNQWIISKLGVTGGGEKEKIAESRIGLFACMMHPQAAIENEKLILATKHIWTMFMVDDFLESIPKEEFPEVKKTVSEMAKGGFQEPPINYKHPCLPLYSECVAELRNAFPPSLFSRYLKVLTSYLDAVEQEVDHTLAKSYVPSPEHYSKMRRETGFMEVMACMMTEFCLGLELGEADVESGEFRELVTCINNHVVMVNDLFSFRKELYEKPESYSHNWLAVLFHHSPTSTSFQEVVYKLRDMIREEEEKILSLQKKLIRRAIAKNNEHLLRFAHSFPMSAAGHLRWSYITARYHGCGNTLLTGEMFHGTWLLHQRATVIMPTRSPRHEYLVTF